MHQAIRPPSSDVEVLQRACELPSRGAFSARGHARSSVPAVASNTNGNAPTLLNHAARVHILKKTTILLIVCGLLLRKGARHKSCAEAVRLQAPQARPGACPQAAPMQGT